MDFNKKGIGWWFLCPSNPYSSHPLFEGILGKFAIDGDGPVAPDLDFTCIASPEGIVDVAEGGRALGVGTLGLDFIPLHLDELGFGTTDSGEAGNEHGPLGLLLFEGSNDLEGIGGFETEDGGSRIGELIVVHDLVLVGVVV